MCSRPSAAAGSSPPRTAPPEPALSGPARALRLLEQHQLYLSSLRPAPRSAPVLARLPAAVAGGDGEGTLLLTTPVGSLAEVTDALRGLRGAVAASAAAEGWVSAAIDLRLQPAGGSEVHAGVRPLLTDVVEAAAAVLAGRALPEVEEGLDVRSAVARTRRGVPLTPVLRRPGTTDAADERLRREVPPHHG